MAIIYEKNFTDPNEKVVRQFTNCCGASDKGTEYGVVCRGCYSPIAVSYTHLTLPTNA